MRYEKVLLVNPSQDVEWPGLTPPLGLGYLAQSMEEHGICYDVLDMNLGYGWKQLRRKLDEFRPELVGMSMITRNYRGFYRTLEQIKSHDGRIAVDLLEDLTIVRPAAVEQAAGLVLRERTVGLRMEDQ